MPRFRTGKPVRIVFPCAGAAPGTTFPVKVFEATGLGGDPVDTLQATVGDDGCGASVTWTYDHSRYADKVSSARYVLVAELGGRATASEPLEFVDTFRATLTGNGGAPAAHRVVFLHADRGPPIETQTDDSGHVAVDVPPGSYHVELKGPVPPERRVFHAADAAAADGGETADAPTTDAATAKDAGVSTKPDGGVVEAANDDGDAEDDDDGADTSLHDAGPPAGVTTTRPFVVGMNQAWIDGAFGSSLSADFKKATWQTMFERTRDAGCKALRIWLFLGEPMAGVTWVAGDPQVPAGVEASYLANVGTLIQLATQTGVKIYWTGVYGIREGWADPIDHARIYNIISNKFGHRDLFHQRVLGPVLDKIKATPSAIYGWDIQNEIDAYARTWLFSDGWTGAKDFIRATASFIHGRAPGVKVSCSVGWDHAVDRIIDGTLDGLGMDFFDLHEYTDNPTITRGADAVSHANAQGIPIIVGEFGRATTAVDPAAQATHARETLEDCYRQGFTAAFAWRLVDTQPGNMQHSYYDGSTARPAVQALRTFALAHP